MSQNHELEMLRGAIALALEQIRSGHANDWAVDTLRDALAGRDHRPTPPDKSEKSASR